MFKMLNKVFFFKVFIKEQITKKGTSYRYLFIHLSKGCNTT